ncbi:MAG: MotA/TolQ/ExbB proton channel family protein [Candidatus Omnitrophica bacterium]|nr:MotA/TolQ/ExbB proton channel family protein [Candidatus Omnitrophota bacterium]
MIIQSLLSFSLISTEWIIYLLIILSVLSWAIILERYFILLRKKGNIRHLNEKIQDALQEHDLEKILQILKDEPTSTACVATQVLRYLKKSGKNMEDYLAIILSQEKLQLESRITFLGTIVSIAPFIGLLGTVLGIIHAFHGLSVSKPGGDVVMAGVSEALVATALGLFIAIPAAAAYNYFVRTVRKIILSSENFTRSLLITFQNNP